MKANRTGRAGDRGREEAGRAGRRGARRGESSRREDLAEPLHPRGGAERRAARHTGDRGLSHGKSSAR